MTAPDDGCDVRTLAAGYHAGTTIAPHRHRWGQLVFAASGVMHVATDRAAWLIPPTRAIWIPAGHRHGIVMRGEVAMRTLYIALPRAHALPTAPRVIGVPALLRELILHILRIGVLVRHRAEHERLAGLLVDLILAAGTEDLMLPLPRDPRARRLAEHWQAHPADERALAELAREVGASLRTMQRLFSGETGLTLQAWRQRARLIHAVTLLASGTSVTNTALDCGYRSVAAFGSAFSRHFGKPPGRYVARG